ncbi:MAG: M23 family metallopeptidase [Deltaproteobacteria bacterium]|nr:M23 family metallopeptidase [Deltaproteobacteria bacterium]
MTNQRLTCLSVTALLAACHAPEPPAAVPVTPVAAAVALPPAPALVPPPAPGVVTVRDTTVRLGQGTLGGVLASAGVSAEDAARALAALPQTFEPRRMRAADLVGIRSEDGALAELELRGFREDGAPQRVSVTRGPDGTWHSATAAAEVRVVQEVVRGTIRDTLYDSLIALREGPALINRFVDVFDSQVDFYREVQNGDTFRLVVEKRYAGDRLVGYGRVLAAEYRQAGRTLRGFWWAGPEGKGGHYDERGRALLTAFLKTPMEFTRITSSFGMRFHPVLHERRAHNGVDYGAPTGTPVWSVGDGRVLSARAEGACGNAVLVQHPNGLTTGYCHLSRFAAGMRAGARVGQRQVIGYVGTTGRSTAPHLHFLMKRNGDYVNPQKIEAPRRAGLSGAELAKFHAILPDLVSRLENGSGA